ncbi:MAG: hypothetical protein PVJ85_08100, partial [Anaerolineae bacterium]
TPRWQILMDLRTALPSAYIVRGWNVAALIIPHRQSIGKAEIFDRLQHLPPSMLASWAWMW